MSEKLKSICNFTYTNYDENIVTMLYVDISKSNNLEIKRKKRNFKINEVLDIENNDKEIDYLLDSSTGYGIISPKILTTTTNSISITEDMLYNNIVQDIDNSTNKPHNLTSATLNYKMTNDKNLTAYENFELNKRKIASKIQMCNTIIATEGRIGFGKGVLVGKNLWKFFYEPISILTNLNIILENQIDPDKIIVCSGKNIDQPGIMVQFNSQKNIAYIHKTENWEYQYCWFTVK